MSDMRTFKILIGNYPHTQPIKQRTIASDRFDLDFVEYEPVWDGFKSMIRDEQFDIAEMAAVTYMIAKAHDKDFALLPAAMYGRFQHPYAIVNVGSGITEPSDLNGKRVGIRSFTTTTGAWLRGILANDYSVDLDSIRWVTFEEPHVAEYVDRTQRAPAGRAIVPMLLDGELDAVLGERSNDPRARPLFAAAAAEAQRWFAAHGVVPINHLVVVRGALARKNPEAVHAIYELLLRGKRLAGANAQPDPVPFGIEGNRRSLELLARYIHEQNLIPRAMSVDEMFAETAGIVAEID
jgi:4,5-dihydroxyphthalate decarboxylase